MKPLRHLLVLAGLLASVIAAQAQGTFTWTGGGGDNDPANPANWLGGAAPAGDGTEDFVFGDSPINNPDLPNDFSAHNITLTGLGTYYFWGHSDYVTPTNLTLTGDVVADVTAGPFFVFNQDTLTLTAGSHLFNNPAGDGTGLDLYVFGSLAGSGDIVKQGGRSLTIASQDDSSTYTGNIDLQEGDLNVSGDGALGTGTITLNGGRMNVAIYETDHTVTLYNNLLFTANTASFSGGYQDPSLLTFTGTATAMAGVTDVYLYVDNLAQLTLAGGVGETTPGTNFLIDGYGTVIFRGPLDYTGNTEVTDGTTLIFGSFAPPFANSLVTYGSGYIGSEITSYVQPDFLDRFDKSAMTGIVGFDSPNLSCPQSFYEDIDLTGFDSNVRLGTATSAILSGTITPQGGTYQFAGRGILQVTSDLSGSLDLTVTEGLQLYLSGTNDYSGLTYAAAGGAAIFDSSGSIPLGNLLESSTSGYIGVTENWGDTAQNFLTNFNQANTYGVIGFDVTDPFDPPGSGWWVSDDIDLTGFNSSVYLGTSTVATLAGEITPQSDTYRFTGFRNGQLTVESTLSDIDLSTPRYVVLGLDARDIYSPTAPGVSYRPSVTLTGDNSYTGGTYLYSGQLIVGQSNGTIGVDATTALGTGEVYLQYFGDTPTGLSTTDHGIIINNGFDFDDNDGFTFSGPHDFTLAGNLKGCLSYGFIDKIDDNTVTLTGDNSGLDIGFRIMRGLMIFGSDTAPGLSTIELLNNDSSGGAIEFTSNAPEMGSLQGQNNTTVELNTALLTIHQSNDGTYAGVISGPGGIIKDGSASLSLTGVNTYSGGTTITSGTLFAGSNAALGTGGVLMEGGTLSLGNGVSLLNTVSFGTYGGFLGGTGNFVGPVTIGPNAHIAPGNSTGLLTFSGGLTWDQDGAFDVQIQSAGGSPGYGYDSINVTGGLVFNATLANPFVLNLISLDLFGTPGQDVADFDNSSGYAWLIAHSDNLSGFDPNSVSIVTTGFTNNLGSGGFNVTAVGDDIFLNFTPVPEPSTYALIGLGLSAVLFPALRRRKRN